MDILEGHKFWDGPFTNSKLSDLIVCWPAYVGERELQLTLVILVREDFAPATGALRPKIEFYDTKANAKGNVTSGIQSQYNITMFSDNSDITGEKLNAKKVHVLPINFPSGAGKWGRMYINLQGSSFTAGNFVIGISENGAPVLPSFPQPKNRNVF